MELLLPTIPDMIIPVHSELIGQAIDFIRTFVSALHLY